MNRSIGYLALIVWGLAACSSGAGIGDEASAVGSDSASPAFDVSRDPPLSDATASPPLLDVLEPPSDLGATLSDADERVNDTGDDPCPGCVGAPCDDHEDCFSGWCVEGPEGSICTKTCEGACPEGFACKEVASGSGDPVFICVYAHLPYCRPCYTDADCAHPLTTGIDSRCISHGEALGSYCATACEGGQGCPSNALCAEVALETGSAELCTPLEGEECTCSSWAIEVAAETGCLVENEFGSCQGSRVCQDDGLSACSGDAPTIEACNELDDDCDGETDEDFPELGETCDGDDEDLCAGGVWSCSEQGTSVCTDSAQVQAELCNGLDDDCDEAVDEDFQQLGEACDGADADLCADGVWTCDGLGVTCEESGDLVELCNGLDDDCDEAIDEDYPDLGEACDSEDDDDCMFGVWSCVDDGMTCEEPEVPELTLTDIDGSADLKLGDPCGSGVCGGGSVTCSDDLVSLTCSSNTESSLETCNGLDDDCDGLTDEDFSVGGSVSFTDEDGSEGLALGENCGVGLCAGGTVVCDAQGTGLACSSAGAASVDLCNGLDDDCDGLTDEDYSLGGSVTINDPSSPEPLTLGDACGVGLCVGGNIVCTPEGTGLMCSTAAMAAEDVCDGLDNDCDGVSDEAYISGGSFNLTDLNGTEGLTKGDPCGAGACQGGVVVCSADMGALVCSTHDVVDVDVCDNIDNDCDGDTDEDYISGGSVVYDDPSGATALTKGDPCGAGVCDGGSVVCAADKMSLTCSNSPEGGELCDDIDNDCDGEIDEGCDDDGDGYCDANLELIGSPPICPLGGGDCDDSAEFIHPAMAESCDDIDNNCTAGVDEGCDDDGDDFCDAAMEVVGSPAVCPAGLNDCNDGDPAINSAASELCDDLDNDCNGAMDEGCNDDSDDYCDADMVTVGNPSVCEAGGGDCDDTRDDVFPLALEVCDDIDNNCADGVDEACDGDGDGYCDADAIVVGAPAVCSQGSGDCNDANAAIHPGAIEICDDVDNDCVDGIDFGCDDDGDGYCDTEMTVVSLPDTCPMGGGDCNDTDEDINPGANEICDDLDNNCSAGIDEGCDDDGDDFCDAGMTLVGTPASCPLGGADCQDDNPLINPGATEICDDLDNDCANGIDEGCDDDDDGYCDAEMLTEGSPATCPQGGGDCNDNAGLINPGAAEVCDDLDNDCALGVDEGCDDDGDDFCDLTMEVVGSPQSCPLGGGDCADTNDSVNPNATEVCDNIDNNCALGVDEGCDDDGDDFCDADMAIIGNPDVCPLGSGDCDDMSGEVHPASPELCDDIDNNCASGIDEGCDDDGDEFCDAQMSVIGLPGVCPQGPGDCADTDEDINPSQLDLCDAIDNDCDGATDGPYLDGSVTYDDDPSGPALTKGDACGAGACSGGVVICGPDGVSLVCSTDNAAGSGELCDGIDNDCNGEVDEGCDDDGDNYCDASMTVIGVPSVCPNGLGDCNDDAPGINPGMSEICDDIDNDCAFGVDQGCDDDGDGYCDGDMIILGSPSICTLGGGDCVDTSESIHPNATELCDGLDNDCNQGADEGCDDDGDGYCDISMVTVGTPWSCPSGGGDCNDGNGSVNPAASEVCDNIDNDCNEGADEGCDDDNDNYCDATMSVIGTPATCTMGGGDCNDNANDINPGATEVCDSADNDCDQSVDEGCDDDNDNYCDAAMSVIGTPTTCTMGGGDCNDNSDDINPGEAEQCNGIDDNCVGGVDEGLSAPVNSNQNGACEGSVQTCTGASGWIDDYSAVATYNQPETPSAAYLDENCDGVDGDKDNAVFVATTGINNNICSQKAPCSTISHGIARAEVQGKAHVYIRAGTYSGPIVLADGVSLYGGYDSGWGRDAHTVPGHLVTINGGYDSGTQQYLVLRAVNVDATVADLKLNAPNASGRLSSGQGRSSYGVHGRNSELTLTRMTIDQGNGYSGQGGANGSSASQSSAPGGQGGANGSSASQSSAPGGNDGGNANQYVTACNNSSHGNGGSGGSYTCSGTSTKGGNGGHGGEMDTSCGWTGFCSNCNATSGDDGASGSGPSASSGGGAGDGGSPCQQGDDASNGSKSNGNGGSAAGPKGRLVSYYWYAKDGGNGSLGSHGRGGGGGGGSGGCDAGAFQADSYGAGGGGGGAGGCRAPSAGSAGKGGGGSFGVFGYSSDLTITQVSFVRGNGGDGGNGGSGGLGQPGGSGGDGGNAVGNAKRGGYGGDGGRGGHSGGGGGGAGGHSYGIYSYDSDVSQSSNSFSSGSVGDGGNGGSSSGGNGSSGTNGTLGSISTCANASGC